MKFYTYLYHALEYLIICFPLLFELATDYYRIEIKHKNDNHKWDLVTRSIMCVAAGFGTMIWFDHNIIQGTIYSGCIFITSFDYTLNAARILFAGQKLDGGIFHKGEKSDTDRFLTQLPVHAEILARAWFYGVGYAVYYHWDMIVGK